MSDLSELIEINRNIEKQNEEIIRLLKKIAGEGEKSVKADVLNQMKPIPENPFDFSTLGYDDLKDDASEENLEVQSPVEVETPHFEDPLDVGEIYFMEEQTPFKISLINNEIIIDNFNTSAEASDYSLAEMIVNELAQKNKSFDESTVILPESVIGNLPLTLEQCIGEGAKKVYGPWKSMMELLNAPPYLQTELQLDFYKTEEHLLERVFKE